MNTIGQKIASNNFADLSLGLFLIGLVTIFWWPIVGAFLASFGFVAILGSFAASYWWVGIKAKQRKQAKQKAMRAGRRPS
jgi:hypothetical protein